MFPTLYHFIHDVFGISLNFLQVVNTFGFFVALAIAGAFWAMQKEFARKTKEGKFPYSTITTIVGKPFALSDYIWNALLAFIFGFKVVYLGLNAGTGFSPQEHLATTEGNWIAGLLLALVVSALKYRADKKQQLPEPKSVESTVDASHFMGNITTVALLSGFLGAKVFHILEDLDHLTVKVFISDFFSSGGWTFYGGLICGAAGVLIYCKRKGLNLLHVLDAGGPAMMLSYGIGRFGCHFSGDGDWGLPNLHPKPFSWLPDWAWSYTYPHNVLGMGDYPPAEMIPIKGFTGDFSYELMTPVYPTPLYEALMGVGLFFILWRFLRKRNMLPGNMFACYLIFAGIERFVIESIREHGSSLYKMGNLVFSQAQMISVFLVLVGAIWLFWLSKKAKPPVEFPARE